MFTRRNQWETAFCETTSSLVFYVKYDFIFFSFIPSLMQVEYLELNSAKLLRFITETVNVRMVLFSVMRKYEFSNDRSNETEPLVIRAFV